MEAMVQALPMLAAIPELSRERRATWEALVRQHERAVRLSLIAQGYPPDLAREITQATWLRLIERQRAGQIQQMSLPGLAIAQASFLARDHARGERRWAGDAPLAAEPHPAAAPEARVISRDQLRRVESALASQHASARRVFALAHGGEGHSHAQIATATGLSVQRVKQILWELRHKLRQIVGELP
jgi:RNA polymerase sigma factor (sigma-70 family)